MTLTIRGPILSKLDTKRAHFKDTFVGSYCTGLEIQSGTIDLSQTHDS